MKTKEQLVKKKNFIFVSLLLISLIFVSCLTVPARGKELQKITFLPMWLPQPQFAGYYMAKEKGLYEKYGLDVTISQRGYKKDVATSLKQGETHFGIMNLLTAIEQRAKGLKLINVGQIFQRSAIEFVTLRDSGIKTPKDFNGKNIGVWKAVLQAQTLGFLETQGIQANIYPVDDGIHFFLKRAVDIIPVMHYNEYNTLINYGVNPDELRVFKLGQFDMDFPEDGIYCLNRTDTDNPMLARLFVDASLEGWDYAVNHPAETIAVIKKIRLNANLITNEPHLQWMMDAMPEMISPRDQTTPVGHLAESDFDHAVQFLLKTNKISQKVSYDEFYFGR